jgi:hypothetical protein
MNVLKRQKEVIRASPNLKTIVLDTKVVCFGTAQRNIRTETLSKILVN